VQHYLKQQGYCLEAQNHAAELKLRAERRLGELLAAGPKHEGGRPARTGPIVAPVSKTYADQGINKKQAQRWQQIATVPEAAFERQLAEAKESKAELTTAGMLRVANDLKKSATVKEIQKTTSDTCRPSLGTAP